MQDMANNYLYANALNCVLVHATACNRTCFTHTQKTNGKAHLQANGLVKHILLDGMESNGNLLGLARPKRAIHRVHGELLITVEPVLFVHPDQLPIRRDKRVVANRNDTDVLATEQQPLKLDLETLLRLPFLCVDICENVSEVGVYCR